MPQRIVHCDTDREKLLGQTTHTSLGKYAGGIVAAVADQAALSLLGAPGISLLFYSKESYDRYLRRLSEADRNEAIRKRLAEWAPTAVNQGVDWLYRGERRNLTLAA